MEYKKTVRNETYILTEQKYSIGGSFWVLKTLYKGREIDRAVVNRLSQEIKKFFDIK